MTDIQKDIKEAFELIINEIMQIDRFADTEELNFPMENPSEEEQTEWLETFLKLQEDHVRGVLEEYANSQQELIDQLQRENAEERAAHNSHVTELIEVQQTLEQKDAEIELHKGHIRVFKGEISDQKIELERYQKYEAELLENIQKLQQERDFFKNDRDRCERLERSAYIKLEQQAGEIRKLRETRWGE